MSSTSSPFPDATQIGRYGTLSLLKQNVPENANTVAVAFGIDTEVLTFGRDRDSGIRLCYPDVDQLHCKITFEEKKAFLVVLRE
ncbi:hypothetical protein VKT23_020418 [Stygiomarasmius scandens]|uniref:FHA domain-containing protein n=1 Tax=Marasmiellus scandens TaxID=2682957 RepID=A0ABR1IJ38_9AGAR